MKLRGYTNGGFALLGLALSILVFNEAKAQQNGIRKMQAQRIPVINITDLYHPYQDPGDNFDLIMGYALPELDLRAVILDITDAFRKPVADHPALWKDPGGPREAGFIPVLQLNYIFNRNVPCAMGPLNPMRLEEDKMLDIPPFQQEGVNLFLKILRESKEKIEVLSFGSARILAVAYNREPDLLRKKIRLIHLSAGTALPALAAGADAGANSIPGGEWNVALDVHAFTRLLKSDLPIALYPCATENGAFSRGRNNSFWQFSDIGFIKSMQPQLRRYLDYAFSRSGRKDFLRAMDADDSTTNDISFYPKPHHVWETALWINISQRAIIRKKDGHYAIVPRAAITREDRVVPNELRPCKLYPRQNGWFNFSYTGEKSNFKIYDRGDFAENERALQESLPLLYLSFLK